MTSPPLQPNKQQEEEIQSFLKLLFHYNKKFNLTGIGTKEEARTLLVRTGLEFAALVRKKKNVVDIGSGNGIPGVIIKIMFPEIKITLVERRKKRSAFLREVKYNLLKGLEIINNDITSVTNRTWDAVVGYRVAPLPTFLSLAHPILSPDGIAVQRLSNSFMRTIKENGAEFVDKGNNIWYYTDSGIYLAFGLYTF